MPARRPASVRNPDRPLARTHPRQLGRIFENLLENAYTAQSNGRLASYEPVLDSRGVDRAVSLDGGPPLYIQVKGATRPAANGLSTFQAIASEVYAYKQWMAALVTGSQAEGLTSCHLIPASVMSALHRRKDESRWWVEIQIPVKPSKWSRYEVPVDQVGPRLVELAQAGGLAVAAPAPRPERGPEEGAFFESSVVAAIYGFSDRIAVYRPTVDFAGRDFMVQLAGSPDHLFLQVKGTEVRTNQHDTPRGAGSVMMKVRRNVLALDPREVFVFCYRPQPGVIDPIWVVDAIELNERASKGSDDRISFNARVDGPDPRWAHRRMRLIDLAPELLRRLQTH